jgi:hypothetical protein
VLREDRKLFVQVFGLFDQQFVLFLDYFILLRQKREALTHPHRQQGNGILG